MKLINFERVINILKKVITLVVINSEIDSGLYFLHDYNGDMYRNNIAEDQNKEQDIQQQQETITVLQENVTQLQTDIEIMFEKQEIVP